MPITTTRTVTTHSSNVAVHTISFRGLAGGIFICLCLAVVFYVMGFATTAWGVRNRTNVGLWETCSCQGNQKHEDWFRAVQAMITIGLIALLIAFILVCIYMCVHTVSKNTTILALVIVCFVGCLFMLVGFIIFGAKAKDRLGVDPNWSFALSVIGSIFCLIAGILAIVQMRESGVRV